MSRSYPAACLVLLVGCHAPISGGWRDSARSGEAEALAGARAAPGLEARYGGVLSDHKAQFRMEGIARRLVESYPDLLGRYRIRLLDCEGINGLSLPGGYIYLTKGLYRRLASDELIAAVLAHEMAHILVKDHFKPRCGDMECALKKELSADSRGADILASAGISSTHLADLIRIIADTQPPGWVRARLENLHDRTAQPTGQVVAVQ